MTGSEEKHKISLSVFLSIVWGLFTWSKYLHRIVRHNVLFSFSSSHEYRVEFLKAALHIMVNRLKAEADGVSIYILLSELLRCFSKYIYFPKCTVTFLTSLFCFRKCYFS